jgi:hypothetical protein
MNWVVDSVRGNDASEKIYVPNIHDHLSIMSRFISKCLDLRTHKARTLNHNLRDKDSPIASMAFHFIKVESALRVKVLILRLHARGGCFGFR